jgi:hypothetical protein
LSELADKMLVIKAGIPADRLVVEACSEMHANVPFYFQLIPMKNNYFERVKPYLIPSFKKVRILQLFRSQLALSELATPSKG